MEIEKEKVSTHRVSGFMGATLLPRDEVLAEVFGPCDKLATVQSQAVPLQAGPLQVGQPISLSTDELRRRWCETLTPQLDRPLTELLGS